MGQGFWGVLALIAGGVFLWLGFTGRGGQVHDALFGAVQTAQQASASGSGG